MQAYKPKHEALGMTPFEYAKAEKRQKLEKHKLATLKNKVTAIPLKEAKEMKVLGHQKSPGAAEGAGAAAASDGTAKEKGLKLRAENDRT